MPNGRRLIDCTGRVARSQIVLLIIRVPAQKFPRQSGGIEVLCGFVSLRPPPVEFSHILVSLLPGG